MAYAGIDYGRGLTNVNMETGIRYGVIPAHAVGDAWYDESEAYYGEPTCPACGTAVQASDEAGYKDFRCSQCEECYWSYNVYGDEALSYSVDTPELKATQGQDGDIFVIFSKYTTRAAFCSPCAPGACYLLSPNEDGAECYAFGPDWFEDENVPYPVTERAA